MPAWAVDLGEDKAQGERLGWMDTAGSVPVVAMGRGDGLDSSPGCAWEVMGGMGLRVSREGCWSLGSAAGRAEVSK